MTTRVVRSPHCCDLLRCSRGWLVAGAGGEPGGGCGGGRARGPLRFGGAHTHLAQDVVDLHDLHQLDRDVVLVGAGPHIHLHRGADAHGRHVQVAHQQVLRPPRQVQQLAVLHWRWQWFVTEGKEGVGRLDGEECTASLPAATLIAGRRKGAGCPLLSTSTLGTPRPPPHLLGYGGEELQHADGVQVVGHAAQARAQLLVVLLRLGKLRTIPGGGGEGEDPAGVSRRAAAVLRGHAGVSSMGACTAASLAHKRQGCIAQALTG
jgi:hypothetical protein